MREGVAGLTREKRANPGKPPLPVATVQLVVDFALGPPPVSRGMGVPPAAYIRHGRGGAWHILLLRCRGADKACRRIPTHCRTEGPIAALITS